MIWEKEGMDIQTYKNLPWSKKKEILIKHNGIPEKPKEEESKLGSFLYEIYLEHFVKPRQEKEIEIAELKSLILPEDHYVR